MMSFGEWVPQFREMVGAMASSAMDAKFNFRWDHCGVGAVLDFYHNWPSCFMFRFLEDCGYMARIAFVMDRLFRKFGLSGKSFIPMLIATGCGVPGVMASRTIENERDRRMTIMVTTFMPCSAKLPIIALIAGAFFLTKVGSRPLLIS